MDAKVSGPLNHLGAAEIVQKIARGETTCEAVTRDCVARIAERDGVVKAWVNFDPELALAQARALDRSQNHGPLHGVPIGVKDIIDTFDAPPYEGYAVTCGVTFTFGGLRINTDGEVLNTDYQPIRGLYAAGELVGGLFYFNYPGGSGLMSGTVFGKIAGTSAGRAGKN